MLKILRVLLQFSPKDTNIFIRDGKIVKKKRLIASILSLCLPACRSVCLSVCSSKFKNLLPTARDFIKFYMSVFRTFVEKICFSLKLHYDICKLMTKSHWLPLRMGNVSHKIELHILVSTIFFPKIMPFMR
jgi:hypothetical protein